MEKRFDPINYVKAHIQLDLAKKKRKKKVFSLGLGV